MANRLKGEASFALDGKDVTLLFDAGAFLEVEDATGIGLLDITNAMSKLRVVAELLRVGLLRGSKLEMSTEDAADVLFLNPASHAAVIAALNAALPDAEAEGSAPADPQAAAASGAGKTTSSAGAKPASRRTSSGARRRG